MPSKKGKKLKLEWGLKRKIKIFNVSI